MRAERGRGGLSNHLEDLIRHPNAGHAGKDEVHQSVKGTLVVRGGAGIAYDDHVVICIPAGIDRGRYPHLSGATGDDDCVDTASP